jgi:hemin uptake protein HemP
MAADRVDTNPVPAGARVAAAPAAESMRVIASDILLAGASQLAIRHRDTVYVLRQTRFGKLILTK